MGPFDAERLPMINRPYQSEIVAADQSVSGDHALLINRDFGRPTGSDERVVDIKEAALLATFDVGDLRVP